MYLYWQQSQHRGKTSLGYRARAYLKKEDNVALLIAGLTDLDGWANVLFLPRHSGHVPLGNGTQKRTTCPPNTGGPGSSQGHTNGWSPLLEPTNNSQREVGTKSIWITLSTDHVNPSILFKCWVFHAASKSFVLVLSLGDGCLHVGLN